MAEQRRTRDGYQWTPLSGLQAGAPCIGVIQPAQKLPRNPEMVYDAIVVGAGYAGLTAARDLCNSGESNQTDTCGTWHTDVRENRSGDTAAGRPRPHRRTHVVIGDRGLSV